jgi:undecaprenyl-diphosphatase
VPLYQVVLLAAVQGLTEFLPISSTAHLVIIPRLLRWHDPGLGFDIALHFGTLLAVVVYFFPTWIDIFRGMIGNKNANRDSNRALPNPDESRRLFGYLVIATIPAMVSGLLLHRAAESTLRTLPVIGCMMVAVGLYMWWSERREKCEKHIDQLRLGDSLAIGIAQACAVVPGVSRSGSTIATGLFRGLTRESATRFSFLLSTPIIAGAALVEGRELLHTGLPPYMRMPFILGAVVSAIVGYAAIWALIRYLKTNSLMVFVIYRIAVGLFILGFSFAVGG